MILLNRIVRHEAPTSTDSNAIEEHQHMSIYCPICDTIKSNPKHKTCGNQSCRSALGWSAERRNLHKKSFNPNIGGGRRKGSKNKNPYPKSPAVIERFRQDSINKKQKCDNMTSEERKLYYGTNFGSSPEVQERCRNIATENVLKRGTSKKGKYTPKFPHKYIGDCTNIIYRSMWEKRVMEYLDNNSNITRWASEEIIIPYISPVDSKKHRYYPDFYVETSQTDGTTRRILIEVKPAAQTVPPKTPARRTKRYLSEVMTYGVNQAKWNAAKDFCIDKGWEFKVITEAELFRKK